MKRFIEGENRSQSTLFPERLDDYIAEDNPVRIIDVFIDELDLGQLGFQGVDPQATGRPAYHPAILLKLYVYGYLNRVQSSCRFERETQRNVELMWLTGRLMPDFKTIADFRKDNAYLGTRRTGVADTAYFNDCLRSLSVALAIAAGFGVRPNKVASLETTSLTPRHNLGSDQAINRINSSNRPRKTKGWLSAAQTPPITATSSPIDALQLVMGSGDVLISTREPALVA